MITKDATIPEVVGRFPATRGVFDRYGLHGCGGALGPKETLEFFARVHGAPLDALLRELEEAASAPQLTGVEYQESTADSLYRRFFAAGIVVLFAGGAALGMTVLGLALLEGGLVNLNLLPWIQTHGNAQVFGFLGMFAMGFAYQGFPRFKGVALRATRAAVASWWLMTAGLALRATALIPGGVFAYTATAGALLQTASIVTFLSVLWTTLRESRLHEPWDRWVMAAFGSFLVAGVAEPLLTWRMLTLPSDAERLRFVADAFAPIRNVQILGFGVLLVLGVGQRILPPAFGFREVKARASGLALTFAVGALVTGIAAWIGYRATAIAFLATVAWGADMAFFAVALAMAFLLQGFSGGAPGASTKFLRAAFVWLLVGALLTATVPIALAMGHGFPHGLFGAARHAVGLGFLGLTIVGVASKVVPTLQGLDPGAQPSHVIPFALLNGGLALRIGGQVFSDGGGAVPLALTAAGGALTAFGFFLWGIAVLGLLRKRGAPAPSGPATISPDEVVARIVDAFPGTLPVFAAHGFRELSNPILRHTIGRRVTVRAACSMKNVDLERFLGALRKAASSDVAQGRHDSTPTSP